MSTTRRVFLQAALAGGALASLAGTARAIERSAASAPRRKGLSILILGGTNFIGPHIVDAAKARGHTVTLFNRGITETRKQTPVDGVEKLVGDRDPTKGEGLKALEGKKFDAVVDTSGFVPRIVKASAELLAPNVKHYIFISSLSVYSDNSKPGKDESDTLGTMADPTVEEMGAQFENYGPLKVLCEQAAEKAMPGRVANIRPGYIVGPGDGSDRFSYWPIRATRGGEMLAPGRPEDPLQVIDARDLAAWIILCIENKTVGEFNATGPATTLAWGEALAACVNASSTPPKPTLVWIPADFLAANGLPAGELPIWLPGGVGGEGEHAGFHTRSVKKAVAAGLTFRPIQTICNDLVAWWPKEVERRQRVTKEMMEKAEKEGAPKPNMPEPSKLRAGIDPEREASLIKAWTERDKAPPDSEQRK
ncbi:MAG: NAD-dependent epimerase/dehydratase family protein [Phycisphaerales bacterium]|nr:NAD-dependent epimerase/dehydratase family protein [Phycisphaerales bacterium]